MSFLLVTSHGVPVAEETVAERAVARLRKIGRGAVIRTDTWTAIAVAVDASPISHAQVEARGKLIAKLARAFRGGK